MFNPDCKSAKFARSKSLTKSFNSLFVIKRTSYHVSLREMTSLR